MRQRRSSLTPEQIDAARRQISDRIAPLLGDAARVAVFAAVRGEAGVAIDRLAEEGRLFAWPISDADNRELTFHASVAEPTDTGLYGIPEPAPDCALDAATIDAVLVPGLAFSRDGGRLGHGAGYYDRFLPRLREDTLRIGVCYGWQVIEDLPLEPHDVPMTHVVTDNETVITGH